MALNTASPQSADSPAPPSWAVGDLLVHRIDEVALPPQTGPWLLPAATPDVVGGTPWLRPDFATETASCVWPATRSPSRRTVCAY